MEGYVENRRIHSLGGVDITDDILTLINEDRGLNSTPISVLPTLFFADGPGVLDANGQMEGQVNAAIGSEVFDSGKYYAVLSGDDADEIVGVLVVTSDIASTTHRLDHGARDRRLPAVPPVRLPAVLALWALPAAAMELGPEEMRAFGQEALLRGQGAQALEIPDALLARDGTDAAALVLRAQALRVLNRLPESAAAGRAVWAAATTSGTRYMAATATAQALSLQGGRGLAQLWLRRAVEVAPWAGAARQALDDLRFVRGENPLRLDFDLRLRPTDNVNDGTRVTRFDLLGVSFPVPGALQALGGLSWGFGLEGSWRIAPAPVAETALTFALDQSGAILSDAARALAPEAENGDCALSRLGLERRRRGGRVLSFALGQNWYGGAE